MIISVNWLRKFTTIDIPVKDLVELIGARLVEVEHVIDLGAKYSGVLVVCVAKADKLDGSDHLSVCLIDDGGITADIERDENGLIQVVCGAPNIVAGQMVAWLPPKSVVPETYGSSEPLVLDSRELRGKISNGMIASAKELDLFDEHEVILVLDESLKPGISFASAYELDDYLLDIENKSLTHRPDVFGIIGFAREVAAIQGKKFVSPGLLVNETFDLAGSAEECEISAVVDKPELCSRYQVVVVSGAKSQKSPLLIQTYLARVGVRPINAIVDVTNYLMMLTGQPLHAFDYDKLVKVSGGKADIHVRNARDGEELGLLSGKSIKLSPDDIVIAAGETAIGLAGAMGGANTEIDEKTRSIVIESATFNLFNLRGTQMRHGVFSEAITRFTKGQPAKLTMPVLCEAVKLMGEWASAKPVSKIAESYLARQVEVVIELSVESVNETLGTSFDAAEIKTILENAEFIVEEVEDGKLKVTVPWWRADIHIVEDLAEEVGRLKGFDNIEPTLPIRDFVAISPNEYEKFKCNIRKILVRAGANEVLTYSFLHGDVIHKACQDPDNSYRIINSISPDLQYYRQTLTPSLLGLVYPNIRQCFDKFAVFELNKAHIKSAGLTDENVPIENDLLALVISNKDKLLGAPYYQAKRTLEYLADTIGVEIRFDEIGPNSNPLDAPFEPRRAANVVDKLGQIIGVVGEYKRSVLRNFKLPAQTAGFEIDLEILFEAVKNAKKKYQPISRYPSTERDICFKVDEKVRYSQIIDAAASSLRSDPEEYELSPIDIYESENEATKNITIRVKLTAADHTLTGGEVAGIIDRLTNSVVSSTGAAII